ncbi:hypothetical protein [Fuscovulum ytuae]|uniref:VPLPA-CTERM sorting domain-containing protein n=1 Tax=Fuscovulum ytuae TaxID=3042299 RepID=A0ABY8Q4C8_9RHOB|nr:hypothetical protein [Fuscovulum sp. YMD61]WGV15117.1 hypothetical protein QF092_12615 [Fuscovulum sp. YMD61]
MKKILRAAVAAMLFATGAQAATVDGLFDDYGSVPSAFAAGQVYYFHVTLDEADLAPLPDGLAHSSSVVGSELYFTISGQSTAGQVIGPGLKYRISWMWPALGATSFDFQSGTLLRYLKGNPTGTITTTNTNGPFQGTSFVSQSIGSPTQVGRLAAASATPVPIGGTLPLMLSALGLGAFVMRRRAKAALA